MASDRFFVSGIRNRNLRYVSEAEQNKLRNACVFVCGAKGVGGSTIMTLVRAGVGRLILADMDSAGEIIADTRTRMSFSPKAIMAGTLARGGALKAVFGRPRGADFRERFLNPLRGNFERLIHGLSAALVRRQMNRLMAS